MVVSNGRNKLAHPPEEPLGALVVAQNYNDEATMRQRLPSASCWPCINKQAPCCGISCRPSTGLNGQGVLNR